MKLSSSTAEYHSRAESFTGLREMADSLGRPLEPVLRRHGFTVDVLTDPEAIISYNALCRLLETCADEWDCPDFGLRLAKLQNLNILGPVGLIARLSDTVGEALKALSSRMAIHSNGFTVSLDEGNPKTGTPASITYTPKPRSGLRSANRRTLSRDQQEHTGDGSGHGFIQAGESRLSASGTGRSSTGKTIFRRAGVLRRSVKQFVF
ncbi:MAG: AraC family transcriptional regulator ligand-binding domain-containing protein [Rhodocyclaceae bacterium]|nr:AraC family transcriptional regulator ligand-binding domain-containing protein [Rhodocyclaceae bacterium]